jgi:hypothetical protein
MIEAPINTLYFLVGGSRTLILTELVFVAAPFNTRSKNLFSTSYLILVGNPGIIEVPPDIRMLLYNYLRVLI